MYPQCHSLQSMFTHSTVLLNDPTGDQRQIAKLGQRTITGKEEAKKSVKVQERERERNREREREKHKVKNYLYFKKEKWVSKTAKWSVLMTLQQWSQVLFAPRGRRLGAVSWHWWWRTICHRPAYFAQWHGSSWWTSLSAAVGTGGGCCRRTGFVLKMPEFHLVSDSSLHLK